MENKKVIVSIYIDPELKDKLELEAKADGRPLSNYIERILKKTMEEVKL